MKKINLNSVAFLVLGVFLLVTPALSQAIITSLVTAFYRNIDLLVWVNLAQNFWILNLLPKVVGAALVAGFVWQHLKTRFKCDLPKIKVQTTRLATYSLLFMLCAGLFIFADVPVSDAATTALTGYILDTPVAEYAWLIGAYSVDSFYAIDGSTWDNKVTGVGSTAWATYRTNSTALTEQVLAACTSGHILLKDVEFDYGLTIPENVTVTERNNGLDRTFINAANSQGSPYTISVDTVQSGYYLSQDCMGRIINSWTSLVGVTTINSAIDASSIGDTVFVKNGNYVGTGVLSIDMKSGVDVIGQSRDGVIVGSSDSLLAVRFNGVQNATIKSMTITHTSGTNWYSVYIYGVNPDYNTVEDIHFTNAATWAINIASAKGLTVKNCLCDSSSIYSFLYASGTLTDSTITGNEVRDITVGKAIYVHRIVNTQITNNVLIDAVAEQYNGAIIVQNSAGNSENFEISGNTIIFTKNPPNIVNAIVIGGEFSGDSLTRNFIVANNKILTYAAVTEKFNTGIYVHGYSSTNRTVQNGVVIGNVILGKGLLNYGLVGTQCCFISYSSNSISNATINGLYFDTATNNCTIVGNIFSSCKISICDSGSNNTSVGNNV